VGAYSLCHYSGCALGNNYALRKISTGGGEPVTLDRGEDSWNKYLAVDQTQVYFTTIGKVQALPK
jgi:hypothetical protein